MRSFFFATLAALGLSLFFPVLAVAAGAPSSIQLNKIAAVVNGEIITLHELRSHVGPELIRRGINPGTPGSEQAISQLMTTALNSMVDDILLQQEARRLNIAASDAEVDNELNMMIQRNQTTKEAFETALVAQGQTMSSLRERIRNNILTQRIIGVMIARKVVVTKEDIERYYTQHGHEFTADKSVDISFIVFPPSVDAEAITKKIHSRALSFEKAANDYSIGPQADKGGRLGFVSWIDLIPPLREVVANLEEGKVSQLFMVETYKALLLLNGSTPGRQMSLEEASQDIEQILREPLLQSRFEEYTRLLRGKAVIDIRV